MGKYNYEVLKNWHKSNNNYNWEKGCSGCGGKFGEDERFIRVDVQNGIFRGDDDVFCFHKKCWNGEQSLDKIYNK